MCERLPRPDTPESSMTTSDHYEAGVHYSTATNKLQSRLNEKRRLYSLAPPTWPNSGLQSRGFETTNQCAVLFMFLFSCRLGSKLSLRNLGAAEMYL